MAYGDMGVIFPQWEDEIKGSPAYESYAHDLVNCFKTIEYSKAFEVGFENGVSACAMLYCQYNARLTSVDIRPDTKGHVYLGRVANYVARHTFVHGLADESWKHCQGCDLIYIDGDHSFKAAYGELKVAWDRLVPGGSIVMDDVADLHNATGGYGCAAAALRHCYESEADVAGIRMVGRLLVIEKEL